MRRNTGRDDFCAQKKGSIQDFRHSFAANSMPGLLRRSMERRARKALGTRLQWPQCCFQSRRERKGNEKIPSQRVRLRNKLAHANIWCACYTCAPLYWEIILHNGYYRTTQYWTSGAYRMEPPSPLISWVNPFPSRFLNRTIFFWNALEPHECACCLLFDVIQYYCHFSIFIGSFLYQRAKPTQGTILFINLLGKGLTPRACMGDGVPSDGLLSLGVDAELALWG